jgi:hypothetical protein
VARAKPQPPLNSVRMEGMRVTSCAWPCRRDQAFLPSNACFIRTSRSLYERANGYNYGFTRPWAPGLHRRRRIEVAIDEAPAPQPLCRVRSDGDCRKTNSKAREEATHRKPRRCGRRRGRRSGSACRRIFASAACRGNLLGVVVLLDGPRRHGVRDAGGISLGRCHPNRVQASMMACSSGVLMYATPPRPHASLPAP